jgi:hypothetical protein
MAHRSFATAKWIVDPIVGAGTHTTIASALTSASSGETIFIRPGTYTEDLTLKAGVNLSSFVSEDFFTAHVIILGNATASFTGSCTIAGIQLQTNGGALLTVSGSNATVVVLNNCNLIAATNAITYSSSNASSAISMAYCMGNITTTGVAFFTKSGPGGLTILYSRFNNSGLSTTTATASDGTCNFQYSEFDFAITTSSTNFLGSKNCNYNTSGINTTALTIGGSGANNSNFDFIASGTASAISVGSTLVLSSPIVNSTNTNAITGAGTLTYSNIDFQGSSVKINTTTQTGGLLKGGVSQAPSTGFIGERLETSVSTGAPISLSTATSKTVATLSLTAGVWDVSTICVINGTSQTRNESGPSLVDNTLGTGGVGIDTFDTPTSATAAAGITMVVPAYRFVLTTTTNVFMVANSTFTGSANASGRITGVRVG